MLDACGEVNLLPGELQPGRKDAPVDSSDYKAVRRVKGSCRRDERRSCTPQPGAWVHGDFLNLVDESRHDWHKLIATRLVKLDWAMAKRLLQSSGERR